MKAMLIALMAVFLGACATMQTRAPQASILVDLDPASVDRTVIVKSITADRQGRLYLPDLVSGNVLRIDQQSPMPIMVGRRDNMHANGQTTRDGSGAAIAQLIP